MLSRFVRSVASIRALGFVFLVVTAAFASTACGPMLTPADIEHYGTRSYPGTTRAQVLRASVAAVRSLGYETALVDERAGRIKTAPKLLVVHASGSAHSAHAVGSSLAWTIEITAEGGNAVVHAEPRGYEGGQSVPTTMMSRDYMVSTYDTLFTEIESNLPSGTRRAKVVGAR